MFMDSSFGLKSFLPLAQIFDLVGESQGASEASARYVGRASPRPADSAWSFQKPARMPLLVTLLSKTFEWCRHSQLCIRGFS